MSYHDWFTLWYSPSDDDIIAYITIERIVEIGGAVHPDVQSKRYSTNEVNQGMAKLQRWCRLNCSTPPKPVNVMGKTGFAFKCNAEAVLFKLTWG